MHISKKRFRKYVHEVYLHENFKLFEWTGPLRGVQKIKMGDFKFSIR